MRRGEFQIIDRFFTHDAFGEWRSQGVGDDCAIIDMPGNRIAVTTDMMAVGTHFLPGARPEDIGYKALAVNLSDLAAAGASPRAFFLSIGLPACGFFPRPDGPCGELGLRASRGRHDPNG